MSYGIPHFPHASAPERFKAMYPPDKIRFRQNVPAELQTQKNRIEAQGYYAHTTALDECVGELMRTLADAGLQTNTILVFTSDHGEMLGSHGVATTTKQVPWDEAAHVPFLIRYPEAHGNLGRVTSNPLTTPDIMPTLLMLAGVKIPKTVEGKDLSDVVRNGREIPNCAALYMGVAPFARKEINTAYRAIRTDRYTYVRALDGPWLLFDNENDPYQTNNLVGQSQHIKLCRKFEKQLQYALESVRDDFHPAAYYVNKFGYELAPHGSLSYEPGVKVQSPK